VKSSQLVDADVGTVIVPSMSRRLFLQGLAAGSTVLALGAAHAVAEPGAVARARAEKRPDGRSRLPPGQYLLHHLRFMGGHQGDPSPGLLRLRIHGEVEKPYELDFAALLRMPQVEQNCDVHCVTRWSLLDCHWTGVRVADLIARAQPKAAARYVIFEAAHDYSSNVLLSEAMAPNVLVAHRFRDQPLAPGHGAPLRALIPDLYFWKSAKWLTGIRVSARNARGYWELRGYHNHGDPWQQERYG
jgi:DMSO/TMAO reductase YedYZ molybdopterin-dependent catalytic subunit